MSVCLSNCSALRSSWKETSKVIIGTEGSEKKALRGTVNTWTREHEHQLIEIGWAGNLPLEVYRLVWNVARYSLTFKRAFAFSQIGRSASFKQLCCAVDAVESNSCDRDLSYVSVSLEWSSTWSCLSEKLCWCGWYNMSFLAWLLISFSTTRQGTWGAAFSGNLRLSLGSLANGSACYLVGRLVLGSWL